MRLATIPALLLLVSGATMAWADAPTDTTANADDPAFSYNYKEDLPRVALVFVPAEGAELNSSTGDGEWEMKNHVVIKKSASDPVAYSVVPTGSGYLKKGLVFDHTADTPSQIAGLSLGTRTSNPGYVVEITRGLFGLDNPWCATAVGDHDVVLVRAPGDERPVPKDSCVDLFTPDP